MAGSHGPGDAAEAADLWPSRRGRLDLAVPSDYRIAGITVLGAEFTDVEAVKLFSGLQVGDEVTFPGDRISDAVRNLWDQRLFSDVSIELAERRGDDVYLVIRVVEMPD